MGMEIGKRRKRSKSAAFYSYRILGTRQIVGQSDNAILFDRNINKSSRDLHTMYEEAFRHANTTNQYIPDNRLLDQ